MHANNLATKIGTALLMFVVGSTVANANDNQQLQTQQNLSTGHFVESQNKSASYSSERAQYDNSHAISSLDQLSYFGRLNTKDYNQLSQSVQNRVAKDFRLTPAEFKTYLTIKSSTAIGQYYQDRNMNPNYLLADYYLQQGNDAKANQYIRNYDQMEHDEVARQLMIQKRFQQFAHDLFPSETPVRLKGAFPRDFTSYGFHPQNKGGLLHVDLGLFNGNKLTENAKYIVPVDIASGTQEKTNLHNLLDHLSSLSNTRVDIYVLGNVSDKAIYQWVDQNQLSFYLSSGKATINRSGQFIPALDKRLSHKLTAGQLIKDNQGTYSVMDWSVVNG